MSRVAIEKIEKGTTAASVFLGEVNYIAERIRRRAFEIFQERGNGDGCSTDDWFRAESDLLRSPESMISDKGGKFELDLSAPGLDSRDIHVAALPDALIVRGSSASRHQEQDENAELCELDRKMLFRRFNLAAPIDPAKVTANFDRGILHITAPKAKAATN
jgi:HSP20 family protein